MSNSTDFIASLAKGLSVLEAFGNDAPRLSASEAAVATGLDRASARRCLLTLKECGYASYDGKYFTLTPKAMRLGSSALTAMPLAQAVQPWLEQLSERLGETVSVSILDGSDITFVARVSPRRIMSIGVLPGTSLPAHCTATGRVLLGALPTADAMQIIQRADLTPSTPLSLTAPDDIKAATERAKAQGYALVSEELEIGMRSLAVPLFSRSNRVVAALTIGVLAAQVNADQLVARCLPALKQAQDGLRNILV